MDSELLYLKMRASFHSRMARQATCDEAGCAHQAFVRAYLDRIERQMSRSRLSLSRPNWVPAGPAVLNIARPELVR